MSEEHTKWQFHVVCRRRRRRFPHAPVCRYLKRRIKKKKCKLTLVSFFVFCVLLFGAIFISCVSCYFLSLSSDFLGATIVCGDGGMQTTTNQNSCMRLHLNGMQQQVQVISQFFGRSFSFLHSFGACVLVKVLFFFFFCWVRKAERERKETKRRGC